MDTALRTDATRSRASEPTAADRREARALPLATRFELGETITPVQRAFLDEHGYLVFAKVLQVDEVARVLSEIDALQERWIAEERREVHGIPLFVGRDPDGKPFIQRFAFSSLFSEYLHELVRDPRFAPVRSLVGDEARVGDREKDGLVFNRNLNVPGSAYPRLGWHTDGLRDLFLNRAVPGPMLNVGLHFDRVKREDGGLRILPGSHRQGFLSMLARKPYFVDHRPDPDEIVVETEPGDLTVHDGRTWHRVERSPHVGWQSLRRTMYVPYVTDAYAPKDERSKTPFYHRLGRIPRELKVALRR
ncbi:MAG: phytanoyl-CoA dioxygenase family protein [Sandaracinus sp.]|nr:phytanoyl-CoA dioxygenase family protein [Myxococcales bacterium]MCB9635592.1 phytanoyl-CoA dioxygenase family protein [Sandaracinus sp.]